MCVCVCVILLETKNKLHLSIIPWLQGAGQVQEKNQGKS